MGWGDGGAIAAPVDAHHRLTADAVASRCATRAARRQRHVIGDRRGGGLDRDRRVRSARRARRLCAARAGCGCTSTRAHGGGARAVAGRTARKLRGIERADSVVWDAHKLLMMPALVHRGAVPPRRATPTQAFAQEASYLFAGDDPDDEWWDLGPAHARVHQADDGDRSCGPRCACTARRGSARSSTGCARSRAALAAQARGGARLRARARRPSATSSASGIGRRARPRTRSTSSTAGCARRRRRRPLLHPQGARGRRGVAAQRAHEPAHRGPRSRPSCSPTCAG